MLDRNIVIFAVFCKSISFAVHVVLSEHLISCIVVMSVAHLLPWVCRDRDSPLAAFFELVKLLAINKAWEDNKDYLFVFYPY